jgi:hypothetical protein
MPRVQTLEKSEKPNAAANKPNIKTVIVIPIALRVLIPGPLRSNYDARAGFGFLTKRVIVILCELLTNLIITSVENGCITRGRLPSNRI